MSVMLHASARENNLEQATIELHNVLWSLQSPDMADKDFAIRQINIWLYLKSPLVSQFVAQGGIEHVIDSMRDSSDTDSPSSSASTESVSSYVELLHEFAKEGRIVQDNLAMFGGVNLLIQFLADYSQLFGSGIKADREYIAVEALATLALVTVGSPEGRKEVMQEGGPEVLMALLSRKHTMAVRRHAASAIIGVANESQGKNIAAFAADMVSLLLELLEQKGHEGLEDAQHAAFGAVVALRRICDSKAAADAFCKAGGLSVTIKRLKANADIDRKALRLPMPLGPSTVRTECKNLLGDVYIASSIVYQDMMVDVLQQHGLSLDSITMTPTAHQNPRCMSSLDKGHDSLSCKTSKHAKLPIPKKTRTGDRDRSLTGAATERDYYQQRAVSKPDQPWFRKVFGCYLPPSHRLG